MDAVGVAIVDVAVNGRAAAGLADVARSDLAARLDQARTGSATTDEDEERERGNETHAAACTGRSAQAAMDLRRRTRITHRLWNEPRAAIDSGRGEHVAIERTLEVEAVGR